MARRCETLLLVMVVAMGCRRPAPPPPAPEPMSSPAPAASTAPAGSAEPAAPSGPPSVGLVDEAAKIEAAKNEAAKEKETPPPKTASLYPRSKQPGFRAHAPQGGETAGEMTGEKPREKTRKKTGKKAAETEGKVVAAREEVAAAPDSTGEAPVQATLRFKNEAGATYKLVEARFVMDGAELPTVITSAQRGQAQQVFSGPLPAGHHVVASRLTYQGADRAIFSYMKGYTFHVKSDDEFVARGAHAVSMTIVCKEKTGFNDPVERRLFVTVE